MGVAERKQREKLKRANDILDAAEEVFFSRDGMNASMDDIAERAEVSKGTLYQYFKNKESLYLGIAARAGCTCGEILGAAGKDTRTGLERVIAIVEAYYYFARKYPDYFRMKSLSDDRLEQAQQEYSDDPLAMQCHQAGMECGSILTGAIEQGMGDGSIRKDVHPFVAMTLLWAQANGVIRLIQTKGEHMAQHHDLDVADIWTEFVAWIRRCLTPPPADS